jgi:hypothetical protein
MTLWLTLLLLATAPAPCPKMPACGIGCPYGMAHDANGCPLCACEKSPLDKIAPPPAPPRPMEAAAFTAFLKQLELAKDRRAFAEKTILGARVSVAQLARVLDTWADDETKLAFTGAVVSRVTDPVNGQRIRVHTKDKETLKKIADALIKEAANRQPPGVVQ